MFILVCRYNRVFAYPGDDVTLTSHLSPETSAVPMEVRWFRGIECIYLYKNGQGTVGRGYEGKVDLFTQELQRGNVSLLLRSVGQADTGIYSCQVITGEEKVEKSIHLYMSGTEILSPDRSGLRFGEQNSLDLEDSVHLLEIKKLLQEKEKDLQNKTEELENTTQELRRMVGLLRDRDAVLQNMSQVADQREVHLKNMAVELETCKAELGTLAQKLQETNKQLQDLRVVLQDKERELEDERKLWEDERKLWEDERRLWEDERRLWEEREEQLLKVNAEISRTTDYSYGPVFSELLEKSTNMLTEMYQDPKDQMEQIERWIHIKREERKMREEQETAEALEKEFLDYVVKMQASLEEEHKKILAVMKSAADLEKGLENVGTDEERSKLETQLEDAIERQMKGKEEIDRLTKEIDLRRTEIEERHKHELEEIREKYEIVSRVESETNLLKTILPDVQTYFRNMAAGMKTVFTTQTPGTEKETPKAWLALSQTDPPEPEDNIIYSMENGDAETFENGMGKSLTEQEMRREMLEFQKARAENFDEDEEINSETQNSEDIEFGSESSVIEQRLEMVNGVIIEERVAQVEIGEKRQTEEQKDEMEEQEEVTEEEDSEEKVEDEKDRVEMVLQDDELVIEEENSEVEVELVDEDSEVEEVVLEHSEVVEVVVKEYEEEEQKYDEVDEVKAEDMDCTQ